MQIGASGGWFMMSAAACACSLAGAWWLCMTLCAVIRGHGSPQSHPADDTMTMLLGLVFCLICEWRAGYYCCGATMHFALGSASCTLALRRLTLAASEACLAKTRSAPHYPRITYAQHSM